MRRRLLLLVAATTLLVVIALLVPLLLLVRQVAATRAVGAATSDAQSIIPLLVVPTPNRDAIQLGVDAVNSRSPRRTTVFLPDGSEAGAPAPRSAEVALAAQGRSFTVDEPNGRAVLVGVRLPSGARAVIRTFVPAAALHAGVTRASVVLVTLALGLLLLALVVAEVLSRSLVRPLLAVADVADRLHDGDLDARARPGGPAEIRRISEALNRLAGRIEALLQAERETVADLSHRLRTPLTALRLDAEALRDAEEAERLGSDVDAVERTVSHVIAQARRPVRPGQASADLDQVARERVTFWSALAEEQGRRVVADLPGHPAPVEVDPGDLAAALDALLNNVFAHTPPPVGFCVTVSAGPPARLVVQDDGAGLTDPALLARGRSGAGSTGLGLDIVRRTAESTGGTLRLSRAPGAGLRVEVQFGPGAR